MLGIFLHYIYAECKFTKISENGVEIRGFLSRALVFDAICGLFSCGLAMHGGLFCLVFSMGGTN